MPNNLFQFTVGGIPANIPDALLVFHVDLLVAAAIVACALVRLPRAIGLFGTTREWVDGHFLRYIPYKPSRQFVQAAHTVYPPPSDSDSVISDTSSESSYAGSNSSYEVKRLTKTGKSVEMRYPPHISAWFKVFRPILSPLRTRLATGFSVGQLVVITLYFYTLVYATFFNSNIITDNSRTGWIAIGQFVFVYAFAQKNNIIGSVLGYGYEKVRSGLIT